jgi:hypothetical protein
VIGSPVRCGLVLLQTTDVGSALQMDKVVSKSRIDEKGSDFAYWQMQPYQARLAALEEIRREYHQWKYHAEPRLQRVCAIVRR